MTGWNDTWKPISWGMCEAEHCTSCARQARKPAVTDSTLALTACARLSSACWHFLSLTFPVQFLAVPGCLLFVAVCVYLWFPHPQKNVASLSFLSSVFLFVFTLLPLPCSLSFRLLQLCPGIVLLEMPESCIFPLQSGMVFLVSSVHFLFVHWNRVGLDFFMMNIVYVLNGHFSISLNTVAALQNLIEGSWLVLYP